MERRTFLQRCSALGAAFGGAVPQAPAAPAAPARPANPEAAVAAPSRGAAAIDRGPPVITHAGSFPTPTLTDSFVVPAKTARLNFGKHTKMAYCPANGYLYTCGGDGQGQHWGGNDSGALDTVGRYDVLTRTYSEDFLYRGHPGEPVPRGVDYTAFAWSPTLKAFWLGPGYAWNFSDRYPWVDLSWSTRNFASYDPATRRFTDRGPKPKGINYEGFAGSWDTTRDRLVFASNQSFLSLNPYTLEVSRHRLNVSSHLVHTADTWYDADTDEFYFVQIATGRVYGYQIAKRTMRLVATTIDRTISAQNSIAVVYLTDSKHCLLVYSEKQVGSPLPWKLVDLASGDVRHLNLYPPGITSHNTGAYHPPTRTIVLTGGSNDGNRRNGAAFHHYQSHL
ncbi:MAG TPA: twin-arginine translocation signal domain-containing protein [Casimicrobiaceae bacterium]|nr:twin-arginine translocation signal domain-containing protein [Casimicrobiaceae bacterium]